MGQGPKLFILHVNENCLLKMPNFSTPKRVLVKCVYNTPMLMIHTTKYIYPILPYNHCSPLHSSTIFVTFSMSRFKPQVTFRVQPYTDSSKLLRAGAPILKYYYSTLYITYNIYDRNTSQKNIYVYSITPQVSSNYILYMLLIS